MGIGTIIRNILCIYVTYTYMLYIYIFVYVKQYENSMKGRWTPGSLRNPIARLWKVFWETRVKNWISKNKRDVNLGKEKDELKFREQKFLHRNSDFRAILNEHIYVIFAETSEPFNLMTKLFCLCFSCTLSYCFAI